jgi:hypothetical protein
MTDPVQIQRLHEVAEPGDKAKIAIASTVTSPLDARPASA